MAELIVTHERWALRETFTIARGSKTHADVIKVTVRDGRYEGHGESVPYARYGESIAEAQAQLLSLQSAVRRGLDRLTLQTLLPPGAARNALDCALWDLDGQRHATPVWRLAGLPRPEPVVSAFTLSLDTPERMGQAAQRHAHRPLLKLKLVDEHDIERVAAVRRSAPQAQLIVDANEGWNVALYLKLIPELQRLGVSLIEQPLPAQDDDALAALPRPIPLCADESCHDRRSLPGLATRYDMVNIKLDKTGGLTEALLLRQAARAQGLKIMVGCMVSTSLSMAPATLVAQGAEIVDLDGPLLLAEDRIGGLEWRGSQLYLSETGLWGHPRPCLTGAV
ncbi:Mandelate racemase/muconate lactonizing protein [Dickeya chrysanthemi Ech1591]|uniref:Dipeptide epimerase n=1 Tax=Dickeya chrysanthemi (strain Ech1591) TaxID=561229 RepID=C6CNT5_DICC1|nr:N-acetyl-D-Glu racemase DgcA [Dickeya chrysanthemi]ACT07611.1 Mandelate racemase/muconate lactonizing protein [Dickeya chrysanthemi Ech1591]